MHPALSADALAKLRQPRPYPAVSLVMPTHRREPDSAQDPVRLRNLLARAEKALDEDPGVTRERRADVLDQLERAAAEIDLVHAEDGLVVFVAPGERQVWTVARRCRSGWSSPTPSSPATSSPRRPPNAPTGR